MEENPIGKLCKGVAGIGMILGIISSVIMGITLNDGYFNFGIFITVLISTFLFCLLLYALGEVLMLLETANSNTYMIYQILAKKIAPQPEKTQPKAAERKKNLEEIQGLGKDAPVSEVWYCPNCSSKNLLTSPSCKDCGTYR